MIKLNVGKSFKTTSGDSVSQMIFISYPEYEMDAILEIAEVSVNGLYIGLSNLCFSDEIEATRDVL